MRFLLVLFLVPSMWAAPQIRVATYNASLALNTRGELAAVLRPGTYFRAKQVAEMIQIIQPDVLLLNEFDFDVNGTAMTRLNDKYFKVSQNGRPPQDFPYRYTAPSNTGTHSGFDFDNNGVVDDTPGDQGYGGDAFGFGEFEGKYGMAVFSKYPIDVDAIRTFEEVLWRDLPGNLLPTSWYDEDERGVFRLSSKSHWDVPIDVDGRRFHFLVSHPTPPVFDGPEDRNGRRNHDEIRMWADYLTEGASGYMGANFPVGERFVIAGDQNADPVRGDSVNSAINQLLDHPKVNASFVPERSGASSESAKYDTATFSLRVDYVLPSLAGFEVTGGAVFWPISPQPGWNLFGASDQDHRPVYLDLEMLPFAHEVIRNLTLIVGNEIVTLEWEGEPDLGYEIQGSPDLGEDSWVTLDGLEIVWQDGVARVEIARSAAKEFLRVKLVEP